MTKQDQALQYYFLAILEENGYYDELRKFMEHQGYNMADMASMLLNSYEDCPDGMSVYYYMDSIEDMLTEHGFKDFHDIDDMVQYLYDNELWKE